MKYKKPKYRIGDLVIAKVAVKAMVGISTEYEYNYIQKIIKEAYYSFSEKEWIYELSDDNITKQYNEENIISVYRNSKWL